ncbi:MAG TPA: AAA family ATPase [Alphaproteobacteria bacterium]|nr:AAA family ATPase [Alphaproteobacteria bacterium]
MQARCFVFAPFRLDVSDQRLWRGETVVPVPPKAFATLCCLVAQAGRLVTKEALLQAVWPDTAVQEDVLTVAIGQLRRILGDRARSPRFIETVHGRGYRFIAPVTASDSDPKCFQTAADQPVPQATAGVPPRIFVGREAALAQVQQWWTTALQGQRQFGFIAGEPGIGKTALVDTFVAQVGATTDVWIGQGQCVNHDGVGEAYFPILEALGRLGRGSHGAELRSVLQQQAPSWLVHLPALLAPGDRERLEHMASTVTPVRMLRELAEALEAVSAIRPLVLVLEDLHWSDRATLEWLAYMARRRDPARVLILSTYRPVEVMARARPLRLLLAELRLHAQCVELVLDSLSEPAVAAYLSQRFSAMSLPANVPQRLHRRTSGHPLFLVAMVDELVRRRSLEAGEEAWEGPGVLSGLMPASLRYYLEQQVAQLADEDQALLEAASVAGTTFTAAAAAAGMAQAEATLEARLTALARQGRFVRAAGTETWPDGTVTACYQFLHELYQEVVYARVSPGHRVRLHQRIGLRKEAAYGAEAPMIATELARHFMRAQDGRRAVGYLRHAAAIAMRRHAYREVIQHCTAGLTLLATLPDTLERARQELVLQTILGPAVIALNGQAAPEVEAIYDRARALCQQLRDTPQLVIVLTHLGVLANNRGQFQAARQLGEQALHLAQEVHDPTGLASAHMLLGNTAFLLGEFEVARRHTAQAIDNARPPQDRVQGFHHDAHLGVFCRARLARVLWYLGYPDQALQWRQEALTLARELAHPMTLAQALLMAATLHLSRREVPLVLEQAEAAMALARHEEYPLMFARGTILRGWALIAQGQREDGVAEIRQGVVAYRAAGIELLLPFFLAVLAETYARMKQAQVGMRLLNEALALSLKHGSHFYEAELYRLKGELLLVQDAGRGVSAEACFRQAVDVARRQQAKSLELRAAMSLSRLWQQQGKRAEAYNLLAPIYGWFTEGFDTADLQDAKALLEALA